MQITRRTALTAAAAQLIIPTAYASSSDEQAVVDHAAGTLQDLRRDPAFGDAAPMIRTARAVLIAPRIIKAGFFLGGEGGAAVLSVHSATGWSAPAFYAIGSASFGLQFGAQQTEMILIIRTDRALQAMIHDRFKFGANAGISVATLGATAGASTTANLNADIVTWGSSTGAYAGISLEGSVIQPQLDSNAEYYGRALSPEDIVLRHRARNAGANSFLHLLSRV